MNDQYRKDKADHSSDRGEYNRVKSKRTQNAPQPVPVNSSMEAEQEENLLIGRNAIREAILSGRDLEKLMVAKGDQNGTARQIIAMAWENRIPIQEVDRRRLDMIARGHQGLAAIASAFPYADVEDMISAAENRKEPLFLVILDGITDPHNVGAIIRTAAAMGAHGVILPYRRSAGLSPAAVKASCGGIEHVLVSRVGNLTQEIKKLQAMGVWIYASDAEGEPFEDVDFSGPCALVIGSEGEGVSRLVMENCDKTVSIPMRQEVMESLNASVAAGILMYRISKSRSLASVTRSVP